MAFNRTLRRAVAATMDLPVLHNDFRPEKMLIAKDVCDLLENESQDWAGLSHALPYDASKVPGPV